jgi:hypothetical protein
MGDDKSVTLGVHEITFAIGSSEGFADCGGVKAIDFVTNCPRSRRSLKGDDTAEKVADGESG